MESSLKRKVNRLNIPKFNEWAPSTRCWQLSETVSSFHSALQEHQNSNSTKSTNRINSHATNTTTSTLYGCCGDCDNTSMKRNWRIRIETILINYDQIYKSNQFFSIRSWWVPWRKNLDRSPRKVEIAGNYQRQHLGRKKIFPGNIYRCPGQFPFNFRQRWREINLSGVMQNLWRRSSSFLAMETYF